MRSSEVVKVSDVTAMPSIPWKPFGFGSPAPRRFPRVRRGNKRQPIVPYKEWKVVRGDTVRDSLPHSTGRQLIDTHDSIYYSFAYVRQPIVLNWSVFGS